MKATYQNPGLYWNSWGWPHFRVECQHGTHGSKSWCNSCIYLSKTTHSYSCNLFIFLRLQWSHGFCWKVVISKWLLASNQTLTINLKIWYINQVMFSLNFFGSYCLSKMNFLRFRKLSYETVLWSIFLQTNVIFTYMNLTCYERKVWLNIECQHSIHASKSWCNSCIYLSKTTHSYSCNLFIFLRLQ